MWNTEAFFALRPEVAAARRQLDHVDAAGRLVGSVVGGLAGSTFTLGFSAPFGGPDLAREYEPADAVAAVVRTGLEGAAAAGAMRVEARLKPPHYGEVEASVAFTLLTAGATVAEANVNYFIDLDADGGYDGWRTGLRKQARRAVTLGEGLGVETSVVPNDDEATWAEAYRVLEQNRVSKGRPMRLSLDYVRSVRDAFPACVRMVVVRHGAQVCAAALLYRVLPGRDVVQYWGDAHDLEASPMGVLVDAVVEHVAATGGRTIDIGISTDHGAPNLGLMQFKRSFGARAENRLEVVGDLAELLGAPAWGSLLG
jgi:hypothetical protein